MSSSSTEKKAPNTPRSTAKAAMAFYDTEQTEDSMPKPSQDVIDKAKASMVVDQVFNEATLKEGYKRKLDNAFNNPPDLSRVAEKRLLQGREGLQDLEKMEAAVSMANKGKAMSRMSPDQIEIEVAHELLDLKKALPALEQDIGDRSTPIPRIDKDMFLSSAENSPVRKTRRSQRKKGGTKATNYNALRKEQKKKFVDYLERIQSWEGVNKSYNNYIKFTGDPDLLTEEDKLKIFRVTEGTILDKFEARGGGRNFTTDNRVKKGHMKKKQAQEFNELLHYHSSFEDAEKAFQEYLKQKHQPELINKEHRLNIFANFESGIADEFDLESHIVRSTGGKRTRRTKRRKQTMRKRHLKKSTKSRKTKRRKRRTLKK